MRFSAVAAAATLAAGVHASSNSTGDVYVTEVVTAYTTFCPFATEITQGGHTYTVSEATTLTITHCPGGCTITKPVVPPTTPTTPGSPQIPAVTSSYSAPIYPTGSNGTANGTASITKPTLSTSAGSSGSASGASSTASTTGSDFTGAANKAFAASGAGLAALVGFAAYVL